MQNEQQPTQEPNPTLQAAEEADWMELGRVETDTKGSNLGMWADGTSGRFVP